MSSIDLNEAQSRLSEIISGLNPEAKALIEDGRNRKLVSIATRWEIAVKVGLKKLDLGEPSRTFLLIAQAMVEGLSLVSADGVFDRYGVSRL